MLLGAMARRETMKKPIKISVVPVGLNYFAPHKFRSTVSIDFGDPIEVHNDLAMQWKNGTKEEKAAANAAVMELLMAGVNSCTLQATDFTTLEIFRTIRRLYAPSGMRLTVADNVALTAGFANGFHKVKDAPRVQDIMQRCHKYNTMLSTYRVDDRNVQRLAGNSFSARDRVRLVRVTVLKLLHLALFGAILVPWMLCAAPVSLFLSCASDHKAKEVKKMSVKGTWKLLLAPFALILLHVSCSSAIFFSFGEIAALVWVFFGDCLLPTVLHTVTSFSHLEISPRAQSDVHYFIVFPLFFHQHEASAEALSGMAYRFPATTSSPRRRDVRHPDVRGWCQGHQVTQRPRHARMAG